MSYLQHTMAVGVIGVSILGLAFVLVTSLVFVLAYRRREKLSWSNGLRLAIGMGGISMSSIVLLLPALASWGKYLLASSSLEDDLAQVSPDVKAAMVARAVASSMNTAMAADLSTYVLLVPCAMLMGLAMTVPFYLTRAPGGEP